MTDIYVASQIYTGEDRVLVGEGTLLAPPTELFRLMHDTVRDSSDAEAHFGLYCESYYHHLRGMWRPNVKFRQIVRYVMRFDRVSFVCSCDTDNNPAEGCHAPILATQLFGRMGATYKGYLPTRKLEGIDHHCHAFGCKAKCHPERLMCYMHWKMVPLNLQREVLRTYRRGQCQDMQVTEAYLMASGNAIRAVREIEERRRTETINKIRGVQ